MTYFKVHWSKFKGTPALKSFSTFIEMYFPEEIRGVRAVSQKNRAQVECILLDVSQWKK